MNSAMVGSSAVGRGRKRKRQVSWAAAELLEEVKTFYMARPVNPSIAPPAVDDGGEGDDADNQPGLALLGLLGVEQSASNPHDSRNSASSLTTGSNGGSASQQGVTAAATAASRDVSSEGGQSVTGGGGNGSGQGEVRAPGSSRLFKGFETTETVVRRKKQVAPPPPPDTPPPPSPPKEGTHLVHRYPKDIWPGHKPPSHAHGVKGTVQDKGRGAAATGESLEFFCDGCDETIPDGKERMECAVCPDEFCLCQACYDEGEVLDKRHEHELLPSGAPFHVTQAAPSAEAAAAAAQALHVTEAQGESSYDHDDLG